MATVDEYTAALGTLKFPEWLAWSVKVSTRARKAHVTIEHDGAVVFTAPASRTPADVADGARRLLGKILVAARDKRDNGVTVVVKDLVSGEGFPLVGHPNRLKIVDDGPPCEVRRLPVGQHRPDGTGSMGSLPFLCLRRDQATARTVIEWYREQGQAWLDKTMPAIAQRLGVRPGLTWEVRPYRAGDRFGGSWATYHPGSAHRIRMDWRVFQFPRELAEHVARHEAAHAIAGGHGPAWQRVMARFGTDWRDLERRTKTADGLTLWNGEVSAARELEPAASMVSGWGA